jgi:hypothetical protein
MHGWSWGFFSGVLHELIGLGGSLCGEYIGVERQTKIAVEVQLQILHQKVRSQEFSIVSECVSHIQQTPSNKASYVDVLEQV